MADLLQILVLGLALGGVYALMGSGLSLIFGVMRIVNLAHPSMIMAGAYVAYWAFRLAGVDPMLMLPVALVILAATGALLYKFVFEREARSARYSEMTVLLTFALAMVVEGLLGAAFTNTQRVTSPEYATDAYFIGSVFIPKGQLYAGMVSLAIISALALISEIFEVRICDPRNHPEPGGCRTSGRKREPGWPGYLRSGAGAGGFSWAHSCHSFSPSFRRSTGSGL